MGELEALTRACPWEVLHALDPLSPAGTQKVQHLTRARFRLLSCTYCLQETSDFSKGPPSSR